MQTQSAQSAELSNCNKKFLCGLSDLCVDPVKAVKESYFQPSNFLFLEM